ncbi:hypothetical protein CRG98_036836 [Punica granatum]|uniref:BHLH domain-containing protein n=1 Tax=Punica granatum TaxID=22663 RepID=A0A2I0IFD6_PUNGR|nr:hypothetical protein CRG98_036836 [Punica granatum]
MDQRPGKRSGPPQAAGASSSSTRVERKTMEKNRRNKMKYLYSMLNSLVPRNYNNQDPKEAKSLPDQIDEAAKYIKRLEARVNEAQEKRNTLAGRKRLHSSTAPDSSASKSAVQTFKSPKMDIQVHWPALEVTLISEMCNHFIFLDAVRVLREERAEVLNVNFSVVGSSVYHLIRAEVII